MVIAAIVDKVLPETMQVDLINVAFENQRANSGLRDVYRYVVRVLCKLQLLFAFSFFFLFS